MAELSPSAPHETMNVFRLPNITRPASAALDRSLFKKTIPIAAARITNPQNLSKYRTHFRQSNELLELEPKILNIRPDPDPILAQKSGKCMLLRPEVKVEEPDTWSITLQKAAEAKEVGVIPYDLVLDYDYWSMRDILAAILPEDMKDEIPVGFSHVGHVAHLNIRSEYLPYKKIIAKVLKDKNPAIKTVIQKVDNVGVHSEYRTFQYEVLYGEDDIVVETRHANCIFHFDWSKVYWNPRLSTEHERLVNLFKPGEVVCDVMAGVGPFAVPAGKKRVFVWANDLNPDCYASLKDNIKRNNTHLFVRPFCEDGHKFIHQAADDVLSLTQTNQNEFQMPLTRTGLKTPVKAKPQNFTIPPTISHYAMNLPASAIDFLPSFRGVYQGHEQLFKPHTETQLPIVHVYCFSDNTDELPVARDKVFKRVSESLGAEIRHGGEDVSVHEVRDIAPYKSMYCASFRLPAEVAFGESIAWD